MGRLAATVAASPAEDPGWVPPVVLPGEECDHGNCPSTVQVSITLPDGKVLGFCGHHGREHSRQLASRGIQPERVGDLMA